MNQYPQHIYPPVWSAQNRGAMDFKEHWRLRLLELLACTGLTQAAFADRVEISPDYVSRLLYPPDKAGRKSLGPVTIRKICSAFNLQAGWFDLPLGTELPGSATPREPARTEPPTRHISDRGPQESGRRTEPIVWPFRIVTYQRITRIRDHFAGHGMPSAINDIDKHLDVLVTRWENEISRNKSSAA